MTPRTAQQFQELREESRERILESALALFARLGYERATIREIAREAGVSQGLMYNYFRSKQDLLRAIFLRNLRDVEESFAQALPNASPEERLESMVRGSFQVLRLNLPFWTLSYGVRFQPAVLAGLGEDVLTWSDAIRAELETRLRDVGAPDPSVGARALFATIDGAAQHYALDPDGYPLELVTEDVIARFCRSPSAGERNALPTEPAP